MYLEIRWPVMSDRRTSGQLFFMAVLYTLFFRSSRGILTKNYRNYYKAVTVKIDSFHNSVILLTKAYFKSRKSCILSHFFHFLKFLLQCSPLHENTSQHPFPIPFLQNVSRLSSAALQIGICRAVWAAVRGADAVRAKGSPV